MTPESHTAETEMKIPWANAWGIFISVSDRRRISNAGILRRLLRRRKNDARKTA